MRRKGIDEKKEVERSIEEIKDLREGGGIIVPKGWLEHLRVMCGLVERSDKIKIDLDACGLKRVKN